MSCASYLPVIQFNYENLFEYMTPKFYFTFNIYRRYMDLWEFGLLEYWVKEVTPTKAEECFATKKKKIIRQVPIHLYDLTSTFLILGIGVGFAMLCFLIELVNIRVKRHF